MTNLESYPVGESGVELSVEQGVERKEAWHLGGRGGGGEGGG